MQILNLITFIQYFYFYNRINIKRLQAMAQMHSYLIMNAKSELKFVSNETTLEELDETLNQVALSINNGIDLFDNNDLEVNFENIMKQKKLQNQKE